MKAYYRFLTFTTYSDEDPKAIREDEWEEPGNMPEDWEDYIWQFAPDHETAIAQHHDRMDDMNALINSGRPDRDTY